MRGQSENRFAGFKRHKKKTQNNKKTSSSYQTDNNKDVETIRLALIFDRSIIIINGIQNRIKLHFCAVSSDSAVHCHARDPHCACASMPYIFIHSCIHRRFFFIYLISQYFIRWSDKTENRKKKKRNKQTANDHIIHQASAWLFSHTHHIWSAFRILKLIRKLRDN